MKTANKDEKKRILDGLSDLFRQNRRWLLFFGTGTSCAVDKRFGMPALQDHLSEKFDGDRDWDKVKAELRTKTLEQALKGIGLSEETKKKFRQVTGDFIAQIDQEYRDDILLGNKDWVGTKLLKALVGRLPPKNPRLSVITSNYDMLIEYACSFLGIRYLTGFVGEIRKSWNWISAQDSLNRCRTGAGGRRGTVLMNPNPRVELFKVHGSINRFTNKSQQIESDLWTLNPPANVERVVAAPGDQKFEQYADNIDTVSKAREMENETSAFIMIGYGFNDPHLHEQIMARIQVQDCPLVVLTLDLENGEIDKIRDMGSQVWFLVAPRYAKNSNDTSKTVVYMPGETDGLVLEDEKLWSCDVFAERVLGG